MYVCMYACMYIYIYIIEIYTYMCIHVYVCVCIYVYTYICVLSYYTISQHIISYHSITLAGFFGRKTLLQTFLLVLDGDWHAEHHHACASVGSHRVGRKTILFYGIIYYIILSYTILYYNILYYTILYHTMLYENALDGDRHAEHHHACS